MHYVDFQKHGSFPSPAAINVINLVWPLFKIDISLEDHLIDIHILFQFWSDENIAILSVLWES